MSDIRHRLAAQNVMYEMRKALEVGLPMVCKDFAASQHEWRIARVAIGIDDAGNDQLFIWYDSSRPPSPNTDADV